MAFGRRGVFVGTVVLVVAAFPTATLGTGFGVQGSEGQVLFDGHAVAHSVG